MVLEVAVLNIKPGMEQQFEANFAIAQKIISSMPGYRSHQLQKCIENPGQYLLLVNWTKLEDHTIGFRKSAKYQQWKKRLHHFYASFPSVEHYTSIYSQHSESPHDHP
jgi:heme-degrading monooxygenase HmoA